MGKCDSPGFDTVINQTYELRSTVSFSFSKDVVRTNWKSGQENFLRRLAEAKF